MYGIKPHPKRRNERGMKLEKKGGFFA